MPAPSSSTAHLIDFSLNRPELLELLAELDVAGGEVTFTSRADLDQASWTVHVITDVGPNGMATCSGRGGPSSLVDVAFTEAMANLRLDQTAAGIR